jgi:hypothetical protein
LWLAAAFAGRTAWAGPPFLTDDPQPVDLKHWELYLASQWSVANRSASGTLPHIEVNYGALPELQLHAIVPAALAWQSGQPVQYGLGDIELGAKYRFVDEGDRNVPARAPGGGFGGTRPGSGNDASLVAHLDPKELRAVDDLWRRGFAPRLRR